MDSQLRLALFQPDMPTNAGAAMRLCACLGVALDVIEPCGFVLDDRRLRRVAMDYIGNLDWQRHRSWEEFENQLNGRRLILLTTGAAAPHHGFDFRQGDILLAGQESSGVPAFVHNRAEAKLKVPMKEGARSLNVVTAAAIVLAEALRQTGKFAA